MKAEIKSFESPDIVDLENYRPPDSENFGYPLRLFIGPDGEIGEETFDIMVCTPKWFEEQFGKDKDSIVTARYYFFVFEHNFERLMERIRHEVRLCHGDTWKEIAPKIAQFAYWEFENYQPHEKSARFPTQTGRGRLSQIWTRLLRR